MSKKKGEGLGKKNTCWLNRADLTALSLQSSTGSCLVDSHHYHYFINIIIIIVIKDLTKRLEVSDNSVFIIVFIINTNIIKNYEDMKIIYVNCGVKNYLKEDHRVYTGMIFLQLILHSAVYIYDFHIFIISSSSFHGFITNQFNDLLPVGLLT